MKEKYQKIPDTECSLYDICATRNLTQLAKQHYPQHQQIQSFNPGQVRNEFYEYSDRLLVSLKSLQQEMPKIADVNASIAETCDFIYRKTDVPVNEEVVREIFNYLSPKESQKMHVATNPHALFRYKPELIEQTSSQEKTTTNCCCIL